MSLTNEAENNLVLLMFNNTNWANIGDATGLRGSSTAGSFFISLHTADPGETGDQTTSEATYTGYTGGGARQTVARSGAGFTCTADTATNAAAVTFGQNTGSSQTLTHAGFGTGSTGAGHLVGSGAISSPSGGLVATTNVTPSFAIGTLTFVAA